MKNIFVAATLTALFLTSCSSDDVNTSTPDNTGVTAPETYIFKRGGESSVSFGGQTTRILMAEEFVSALKDNTKSETDLNAMFTHVEGESDFTDTDLNASGKNIRSKVAASKDYFSANITVSNEIKADFDAWIAEQANIVFPNWTTTATSGVAGQLQQFNGGSTRYINAKGLELNQAVAKGLIGGLMADQMLNNYLSITVLDEGSNKANNTNDIVEDGKTYTSMEHKWDEAYGYLYGTELDPSFPVLGADSFLNTYLKQVDADSDFSGTANAVFEAFKLGRAAIVAKNYVVRDAQAQIIRENISKVIAVRAVHYLQSGKTKIAEGDMAAAFHQLSEGFGFIYSLQFTRKPNTNAPYFSHNDVQAYVAELMTGNGFWDVSNETLDTISEEIADRFNFSVAQAAN
ncbi:DUF4856 domain-containing protein [Bizionia argentinensis JUB59]|uniref:DUF4856 domain-containing protein n=1 Tax=Bizionia argentinensis JUB59 TaxID=1046627 RepID=G2EAW7_9FLAO|nr:DUF4856 domain-containing protein [Bizionia argentinensis]EGV44248.1 DUF4856 domain-containing protein [Bizionia argentinensis JUB59]